MGNFREFPNKKTMNKYLKKLISTAMALSMLLSASSAVFADENVPVSNDSSEIELYAYTGTETVDLNDITYTFDYDNKTLTMKDMRLSLKLLQHITV